MKTVADFIPSGQFRYYYSLMSSSNQELYRRILDAFARHDSVVDFGSKGVSQERVDALVKSVEYDVPELMRACRVSSYTMTRENKAVERISIQEEIDLAEHVRRLQSCLSVVEGIVSSARRERSIEDRVRVVHDWFTSRCVYQKEAQSCHDAYGALVLKKAVCLGFSNAAKMCLDRLGIPACMVVGYGDDRSAQLTAKEPFDGNHAWLLVKASGGQWYHLDVSNDVVQSSAWGVRSYGHFLISDRRAARGHTFNAGLLPRASQDFGYYKRRGCYAESIHDLERIVGAWDAQRPLVVQFALGNFDYLRKQASTRVGEKLRSLGVHRCVKTSYYRGSGVCCYRPA